jgi:hypothetical protein
MNMNMSGNNNDSNEWKGLPGTSVNMKGFGMGFIGKDVYK